MRSYNLSGNKKSISLTHSVDYIKEFVVIHHSGISFQTPSEKIKMHKEKDFSLPLKVNDDVKNGLFRNKYY